MASKTSALTNSDIFTDNINFQSNFSSNFTEYDFEIVYTGSQPYPEWLVIVLWLLTTIFSIETILGNLLVLLAYKLERSIRRQLSNKFIVSLAITDLIIGMEGFPLLTVYVVGRERWPLGKVLCQIWLCLDYTLCLVSILTVLLITVDRYGSVCYPAKYRVWQTNNRVRVFIVVSWVVPFLFFGMMIFAWDLLTSDQMDESGKCYAPFLNDPYVNMSMYIVYYWTTLVAVSVLYRGIHTAAKTLEDKSKARERQTIALLLGQRCMAQVGVGMLLHSSATNEGATPLEVSFFHRNGADEGKDMEIGHDSGYMTTTTATATTHTNASGGARGSVEAWCEIQRDPISKVPIIITQSPPTSVSLTSDKLSPCPSTPIVISVDSALSSVKSVPHTPPEHEKLAGCGSDFSSLVPDELRSQKSSMISSSSNSTNPSPEKSISTPNHGSIFNQRHQSSLPIFKSRSLSKNRLKQGHSIDHYQFQSEKRSWSLIDRRRSSRYRKNLLPQDSQNSSQDSNFPSLSSLYDDTSLNSVLEFGAMITSINSAETDDESTITSTGSMLHPRRNGSWKTNLGRLFETSDKQSYANGKLIKNSSESSDVWTRSASTSVKSQCSTQIEESIKSSRQSSLKKSDQKIDKSIDEFSQFIPDSEAIPQAQIFLPPILEEEKSSVTKVEPEPTSRRQSTAVGSPPILKIDFGAKERRPQTPSDKIVHLTVPDAAPPGFGNPAFGRKGSATPSVKRKSVEKDWQRASWQSTASSIYRNAKRRTRRGARAVDDDEDSDGREPGSSAEDSNSDKKRSRSFLATLFSNPVAIIHRKRKVTKAERRARKAFRTITVIVGTFALFWSPYYIVATIYGFCQDCVPAPLFLTSYYLCYLNSSVNPFAYAFANRLFRKTFLRILKGDLKRT